MSVQFVGDVHTAQEILFKIRQWDNAVAKMDIQTLTDLCQKDVSVFDVNSQLQGAAAYKQLWEQYSPYFAKDVCVYRQDVKIYAENDLAFVHCYSKVDRSEQNSLNLPWCRTTLCFKKTQGKWKMVHQHISMPRALIEAE
jgi:ketosteroid isomerase-like protein